MRYPVSKAEYKQSTGTEQGETVDLSPEVGLH